MPGSREDDRPYTTTAPPMPANDPVVQWLMEGDPAIRWQVMRDLLGAPVDEVATERARTEHEGWGARLLALRGPDGLWADGACFPDTNAFARATADARAAGEPPPAFPELEDESESAQPWTATYPTLLDLCHLGVPPDSAAMKETARLVQENCRWEYDGLPFFEGEADCCINAGTILVGTYLGIDVEPVVQRLLKDQMPDGGWNCWAETRPAPGSFHSTLDVVDAFLRWEQATGGTDELRESRARGEEYLLSRRLLRSLRTGELVNERWLRLSYPTRWRYDVLKATDYFARRGEPDDQLDEAMAVVRDKRQPDGRWLLENIHEGAVHFHLEEPVGTPSRWNTLRALRVLRWYDGG